jgi:hypothetical protein
VLHDIRVEDCEIHTLFAGLGCLPRTAAGLAAGPEVSGFFLEFSLGWSSEARADDMEKTVCFITWWLWREGLPQGLKPLLSVRPVAKAKALAYLEAKPVRASKSQ